MTIKMKQAMLMGQVETHLAPVSEQHKLHVESIAAFQAMQRQAKMDGFNLQLVSSFRSFDRQLAIWNAKFNGQRPILDANSQKLDPTKLNAEQKIKAILRWSALPGASRHHWGCDIDVYDPNLQAGQALQLIPQEYKAQGPQAPLAQWLSEHIQEFDFFRPYATERGGVNPEPWHLSHRPVSEQALTDFDCAQLAQSLKQAELAAAQDIIHLLPWIEQQVIRNIDT